MAAREQSRKAEKDLSERQRFWLKHLRAAERGCVPLRVDFQRSSPSRRVDLKL